MIIVQIGCLIVGCIIVMLLYKVYNTVVDIRVENAEGIVSKAEIEYWVSKEVGDKDKEYEALLILFYGSVLNPISKKTNRDQYNFFIEIYRENFIALGKPVPGYPFLDE